MIWESRRWPWYLVAGSTHCLGRRQGQAKVMRRLSLAPCLLLLESWMWGAACSTRREENWRRRMHTESWRERAVHTHKIWFHHCHGFTASKLYFLMLLASWPCHPYSITDEEKPDIAKIRNMYSFGMYEHKHYVHTGFHRGYLSLLVNFPSPNQIFFVLTKSVIGHLLPTWFCSTTYKHNLFSISYLNSILNEEKKEIFS